MKVAIVYDSRTGTTQAAAQAIGAELEKNGHDCTVQSVDEAEPDEVGAADLILIGSWTQGLFLILQHPTAATMKFIDRLGDLSGKRAVVFCTYKLAIGSTLKQMSRVVATKGADVVGSFKFRGPKPSDAFVSFAATLG